jgi:hypothetical protein
MGLLICSYWNIYNLINFQSHEDLPEQKEICQNIIPGTSSLIEKRLKLIEMTEELNIGVTRAARKLRIKIPTAKVILSSYRKKGIIYRKKREICP